MFTRRAFLKITAAGSVLASVGHVEEAKAAMQQVMPDEEWAREEGRKIPLMAEADLVVVGGSSRAVAAATAAARNGYKVYLVCAMPYLGEDICGCHLYNLEDDETLSTPMARRIFGKGIRPTPLEVKTVLEDELLHHHIDFLYSSMPTNILVSKNGELAGIVIANRSGREAILCRAVIDATHEAAVASCAGVERTPFVPGMQEFSFTVVGNKPKQAKEIIRAERWGKPLSVNGKEYSVTQYTLAIQTEDNSYATMADIEQQIRTLTWDAEQVDSSDLLWYIPNNNVICKEEAGKDCRSVRDLPEDCFITRQYPNLWILGPCATMPRDMARRFMRPFQAMLLGEIIGERISAKMEQWKMQKNVQVKPIGTNGTDWGEIKEQLAPLRPISQTKTVSSPEGAIPVLGHYQVVVMGGGTAGASAGISAARHGAKTLVLDYLHGLGGLSTLGMIGVYWDGFREGYTAQLDKGVLEMGGEGHPRIPRHKGHFPADWKMEWLRRELIAAGGKVWFGVMGCGAVTKGKRVKGIVVTTPHGRGIILCDVLIDSTGSADIAIAAGAEYEYTGANTLAVQGAGTGKWAPGDYYNNNDWLFVDDTDVLDISRAFVQAKAKLKGEFDMVKIPQTRERRRVVGEYAVTVYDVINQRRYPDTISYHRSSFDTHGMIVDPYFILNPPEKRHKIYDADVPLRCLLPKGLDGIITTGLGASAHRDAMPVIRMQPCLQNQGYAVGYLSALCIKEGKLPHKIDIKKVQRHLVDIGNLPERVLTDQEFNGFSREQLKAAAKNVTDQYKGLEVLLTDPGRCRSLMRVEIDRRKSDGEQLILASILCMLGDSSHASVLEKAIRDYDKWDAGWHYTGMGQFGSCLSRLDALIMALGNAKKVSTLPAILEKAALLQPENTFSHFRAIAMATEAIGSQKAKEQLAALLSIPGIRNHSMANYTEARRAVVPGTDDTSTRNAALKELHLAKALYRCGDHNGMARKVLERYAHGLQAHYARYAYETLKS